MIALPEFKIAKFEENVEIHNYHKSKCELQQLFWECTLRCNLACIHCGSDCNSEVGNSDMPLDDFLKVLDEILQEFCPRNILVVTTGGEPLLRKDIIHCGEEITKRGYQWGMVTNALLLDEYSLTSLIDAGLKTISVSMDGFEDDHNWMRGNNGSFAAVVRAIKALVHHKILWDVITCVNTRNLNTLTLFKDFLINLGVKRWRIFTVFPAGRAKNEPELHLSSQQFTDLMEFIKNTKKENRITVNYSCEGFLGKYEYEVRDNQFFCQSGINVASIRNDGAISGCLSVRAHFDQGNIYNDSFLKVWKTKFQKFRNHDWMRKGMCSRCDFFCYCEGGSMHSRDDEGGLTKCSITLT